jgi:hypothetical protein
MSICIVSAVDGGGGGGGSVTGHALVSLVGKWACEASGTGGYMDGRWAYNSGLVLLDGPGG